MNETNCEVLKQFRRQLSDILTPYDTDAQLTKVLRARNYNLKKAEILFREIYCYRQIFEVDTIVTTYKKPEVVEKYEYNSSFGVAKDGTPIRYFAMGGGDNIGFLKSLSGYALQIFMSYMMQLDIIAMRKESERIGREINEITYIIDFNGFSVQDNLHNCIIETALDLTCRMQDYYPEIWANALLVNVPFFFNKIFNIFKPMLRSTLLEKIQIESSESTPELLRKYIDEDVLPEFLGGKRRDSKGDPKCGEFVRFGGQIPEKYYLCNLPPLSPSDTGASSTVIAAKSCFNYPVVVRKPGSYISFEFRTEGASIFFAILYRELGPDPDILNLPTSNERLNEKNEKCRVQLVCPGCRIQSHLAPVDERIKAPWPGVYIFKFDNTSSWFMSKRLIYRIKLTEETES